MGVLSERELDEMDDLLAILNEENRDHTTPQVHMTERCPTCGSDNAGNKGVACTVGSLDPWHAGVSGALDAGDNS
jgi:hypothetical protein